MSIVRESTCPHCVRIRKAGSGELANLVWETDHVIVVTGDHQFFDGYCVVIAKTHVREMHDLPESQALAIFADVLRVGRLLDQNFKPLKMNYASLGNVDEHLHWHVMPRYKSDPDHKDHPWKNATIFDTRPTSQDTVKRLRSIFS